MSSLRQREVSNLHTPLRDRPFSRRLPIGRSSAYSARLAWRSRVSNPVKRPCKGHSRADAIPVRRLACAVPAYCARERGTQLPGQGSNLRGLGSEPRVGFRHPPGIALTRHRWVRRQSANSAREGIHGCHSSGIPASSGVRQPFFSLQDAWAATAFSHSPRPPRDRGTTWSIVVAPV